MKNIQVLIVVPIIVTFFSIGYSQDRSIFQPLEYNNTVNDYVPKLELKNTLDEVERKINNSLKECQNDAINYLKQFSYIRPVESGWNKVYLLSPSHCEIAQAKVESNKVTQLKTLNGELISFNYSNLIEKGKVILMSKNYLDIDIILQIYFHENMYNLSKEEEISSAAQSNFESGIELYNADKFFESINYFSKAIEMDNTKPEFFECRGWAYNYVKRYQDGIADFRRVIEIAPNSYKGFFGRGYAKSGLNDYYGANIDYSKSIELNPNFSMAYNNRGYNLCRQQNFTAALIDVNKAIELDGSNYFAIDSRGEIYYNMKKFKEAILEFNNAISLKPNGNSYLFRGKSKFSLGDKKGSCEDWSLANELGSNTALELIKKNCQ